MGIDEVHVKGFPAGWSMAAKPCDSCKSAAALMFCRADSAFLCIGCDAKIHGANKLASRHERVWLCEVCEQAPASVTCKADAAALCVTCDRDIHSANPLSRRHERFPVVPFYDLAASVVKSSADDHHHNPDDDADTSHSEEPEPPAFSFLPNPNPKLTDDAPAMNTNNFFFSDVDHVLDFDYTPSIDPRFHQFHSSGNDSVVPVQPRAPPPPFSPDNCFDIDFCRSKLSSINYTAPSLSQSVSSSDVGVVPDGHSVSDISFSLGRQMNGGDLSVSSANTALNNQASQLCGLDREARVLRYREKRKNRKFEKTIRYASRKAYAETRPRIKGRFAKRTEVEADVDDGIYSSGPDAFIPDTRYGVVPSF